MITKEKVKEEIDQLVTSSKNQIEFLAVTTYVSYLLAEVFVRENRLLFWPQPRKAETSGFSDFFIGYAEIEFPVW